MTAPVPQPSTRRLVGDLVAALVGCLVLGLAVAITTVVAMSIWFHLTADRDLPPGGPTCEYEVDPGSGPAGNGTERRRDHLLFPDRECVVESDAGRTTTHSPVEPERSGAFLRVLGVSALAGFVIGAVIVTHLVRRRAGRMATDPTGEPGTRLSSAEGREPGVDG